MERLTEKILDAEVTLDPIILNKAIILSNIYYDLNRADIRADAAAELDKLVVLLADNSNVRIELSSHTDSRAGDDFNQDLSQRRAQSPVDYIVSQGISRDRLVARGYGETQLINGCINDVPCTEEQHQENRRTEFKVIDIKK